MKSRYAVTVMAVCGVVNASASAAALEGVVRNGTTGKPAGGDEVVVLSMASPAVELGRSRADSLGHFRVAAGDTRGPRAVRVLHHGIAYHQIAVPGVETIEVQVYEAAPALDGMTVDWDVHFQADGDTLQVIEEMIVNNPSSPPRTLDNGRPFEIRLPPEAEVVAGSVQVGGGEPVRQKPTPGGEKGQYYFPLPLNPGATRFAVGYRLPYRGAAAMAPRSVYPLNQLVVVMPESMKLGAESPAAYKPVPGRPGAYFYVAAKPAQSTAFRISGTGSLAAVESGKPHGEGVQAAEPVGARALPARVSGPLYRDRWYFLGGFALVMAATAAGLVANKRKQLRRISA